MELAVKELLRYVNQFDCTTHILKFGNLPIFKFGFQKYSNKL